MEKRLKKILVVIVVFVNLSKIVDKFRKVFVIFIKVKGKFRVILIILFWRLNIFFCIFLGVLV